MIDDHVHAVQEYGVHGRLHFLQRLSKTRTFQPGEGLVGDHILSVDVTGRSGQPTMDGVDGQGPVVPEGLALRDIRCRVDPQDVAPGTMGLDPGDAAVFVGKFRQRIEEILNGQFRHGAEVVIAHMGRDLAHVAPEAVDVGPQVIAPPLPEFVQQDAGPVVSLHLDGVTEDAPDPRRPVQNGLHHLRKEAVSGPAAAVIDHQTLRVPGGFAHMIPVLGNDEEADLPVPLRNIDGDQLRAPGPAEQELGLEAVGDVHHRFRQHHAVFHPAHDGSTHSAGEAGGEVAGEAAGTADVELVGDRLLLGVGLLHGGTAVGPTGAGGEVADHPPRRTGLRSVAQDVVKFRGAVGDVPKSLFRIVGGDWVQDLKLNAAQTGLFHKVQFSGDLLFFHTAPVPPPAGHTPGFLRGRGEQGMDLVIIHFRSLPFLPGA